MGTRKEFFLCIEGVGWPTTEADLSNGFDGDVWITSDFDGDAAATLGCTIHKGLRLSGGVSDSVDPMLGNYSSGGLTVEIVDADDWWPQNFRPHVDGSFTALDVALAYPDTTVRLTDGTAFDAGDTVWLAGKEAVLLGTKVLVGGTIYDYTSSTRGYLGTQRGRVTGRLQTTPGYVWPADDTIVYNWHKFWFHRYADLYVREPGDAASASVRIWSGKVANITQTPAADRTMLSFTGEVVRSVSPMHRPVDLTVRNSWQGWTSSSESGRGRFQAETNLRTSMGWRKIIDVFFEPKEESIDRYYGKYASAEAYHYRWAAGGTAGMRAAWDAGNIQSVTLSDGGSNVVMRLMQIGEEVYMCTGAFRVMLDTGTLMSRNVFEVESFSALGYNTAIPLDSFNQPIVQNFENGIQARFLLDNWPDSYEYNRYAYDRKVSDNPIDIALAHLTSRDDEYFVADCIAGSTTTTVEFTPGTVGATNLWAGAALFAVEDDNQFEARLILSNDADSITVDRAFSNTPTTAKEYQVRNSIYDTLPRGWGMQVPYARIDVAAFESMRDKHFADAHLGKFIVGTQDEVDLFKMVSGYILQPYGVALYISRTTGKLTPRFLGMAQTDGLIEDYIAIGDADIHEIGNINYNLTSPTTAIQLKVRSVEEKVVGIQAIGSEYHFRRLHRINGEFSHGYLPITSDVRKRVSGAMGGDTSDIMCLSADLDAWSDSGGDVTTIEALFNDVDSAAWIINRMRLLINFFAVPPPIVPVTLTFDHLTTVQAGSIISLTKAFQVSAPLSVTRGWTSVVGLVIRSQPILVGEPGVKCTVMLLQDLASALIAPASRLTGSKVGTDGTSDYFIVAPTEYTSRPAADKDYYRFAVGDIIELYDENGALYAGADPGPYTISGFGANNASDPTDASTDIIRIAETVASGTVTTDHYLEFDSWSNSNTTRMDTYCALANASGELTGLPDDGKSYA